MEPIAVKAFYGDDMRRFTIDGTAKFADMLLEVNRRFNLADKTVTLKFKDDEGEMCTFTSDDELLEAVRIARQSVPPILRVQIVVQVESEDAKTATPVAPEVPAWHPAWHPTWHPTAHAWPDSGPAAWMDWNRRGSGKWGKGRSEMEAGNEPHQIEKDEEEEGFRGGKCGGRGGGKKGKGKGMYGMMHEMEVDNEEMFRGGKCGGRGGGKCKGFGGRGFGKPRGCGKGGAFDGPHSARFVADVELPDGSMVVPGVQITKTWRLRNDGDLAWPATAGLVFVKGDELHQNPVHHVGAVAPGEEVDISVVLTAPPVAGRFISYWRLSANAEAEADRWSHRLHLPFGQRVWAQIVVTDDGKCSLTGEEDSVSGNVRAAMRSIPGAVASVVRPVLETAAGGVTKAVEKLDESTGASLNITRLNDAVSAAHETISGFSPRNDAAPVLEIGEPTDVKHHLHVGPDACIPLLPLLNSQEPQEHPVEDDALVSPPLGSEVGDDVDEVEDGVLVAGDSAEAPADVPPGMTESLIADIASVHDAEMAQLKEMGFSDEAKIRTALEMSGGDVQAAVELLY